MGRAQYKGVYELLDNVQYVLKSLRCTGYLAVGVVIIGSAIILLRATPDFWQSYLSNALATLAGILIGVPATILITIRQEKEAEAERTAEVLTSLQDELIYNSDLLRRWSKSPTAKDDIQILDADVKYEVWDAFSDGGEIRWIRNPHLLREISNAFFYLKNLHEWAGWANIAMNYSDLGSAKAPALWAKVQEKEKNCETVVSETIEVIYGTLARYERRHV